MSEFLQMLLCAALFSLFYDLVWAAVRAPIWIYRATRWGLVKRPAPVSAGWDKRFPGGYHLFGQKITRWR